MYNKKLKPAQTADQAYRQSHDEALALISRIQDTIKNMPATTGGNWGAVGTMKHIESQLKEISDQVHNEGEYK
jgi:hypothetical protein